MLPCCCHLFRNRSQMMWKKKWSAQEAQLSVSQRFLPSLYVFCDRILYRNSQQHEIYLFIWLKKQNASDSNVIYLCLFSKRLSSGFSLVFSTTDNGPFQTSKAHLQLQAVGHSQLCHFLKHTVHRAYQKFSIEKFIMWMIHL